VAGHDAPLIFVDRALVNLPDLTEQLIGAGYKVEAVASGDILFDLSRDAMPDLILLTPMLPESGYQVAEELQNHPRLRHIPVVWVIDGAAKTEILTAFQLGAVDCIRAPFEMGELLARVAVHIRLYRQRARQNHLEELNQVKDEILRMVSHDLKNPLGLIIGGTALLREVLSPNPDADRYIKIIEQGADKMRRLINDLLDLALIENHLNLKRQPVQLRDYLASNLEDFTFTAEEKKIKLTFEVPKQSHLVVMLAPQRFSQVIQNLLSNAIKYTEPGGHVSLTYEVHPGQVWIKVSDNGIGIPEKDLPRVFDKFYRVQSAEHLNRTGSGLGMAIVKAIVDQHGGKVWVESTLGEGSVFTVSLPIEEMPLQA
jgi:signal transduction histidine kinase